MPRQLRTAIAGVLLAAAGAFAPVSAQSPAPSPPVEARPAEPAPGAGERRRGSGRFQRRERLEEPREAAPDSSPGHEDAEPPGCRLQPNTLELIV